MNRNERLTNFRKLQVKIILNFSEKFGLHSLVGTGDTNKEHDVADELRRIRTSIVYKDEADFRSKLQKFEKRPTISSGRDNEPEIKNFLNEAHSMCENYENEIEYLRERLNEFEKEKRSFHNLEVYSNTISTEFDACPKISFLRQMKILTDKDISFVEISNIYNEKICELFEENEKLQVLLKNQELLERENKDLKFSLQKLNEEKDSSIKNINEIYQEKFSELFQENDRVSQEISELKKSFEAKENKYLIENKNLKEIAVEANNIKLQQEETIKSLEDKLKNLQDTSEKKQTEHKEKEEKLEIHIKHIQSELNQIKEEKAKVVEEFASANKLILFKDKEISSIKSELEEKIQKGDKENKTLSSIIKVKETEIEKFTEKIREYECKLSSLGNSSSISEEKLKELKSENEKTLAELNKKLEKFKEKINLLDKENENLKQIITKDQITLKELKDYKLKAEINNEANNIIVEENNLLRNEIKLFKQRCEEEISKINDLNAKLIEKEEEKKKISNDCKSLEKKIENLNKLIEDYKEKINYLKEKEKEHDSVKLELEVKPKRTSVIDSIFSVNTETHDNSVDNNLKDNHNTNNLETSSQSEGHNLSYVSNLEFNKYQINLLKILFSDYIYYLYLYDNSLNLQKIVEIILNNFNFYLGTIFNRKDNFNLPSSFIHEILEDLVLKIYDTYITNKFEESRKQKEFNPASLFKDNNSDISQDDITLDVLKRICEDLENSNSLSMINNIGKKEKSLDEIILIFLQKYKKLLDIGGKYYSTIGINNISSFILKDVGQIVHQKVEKYKRGLVDQTRTLIEYVIVNIHSGKLMSNGNEIYNYREYASQFARRDLSCSKDTLYTKGVITSSEAIDNLISYFKNNSKYLSKIVYDGVFDSKSEYIFGKLSISKMLYCNNIEELTITNSFFTQKHLLNVVKLIDNLKNLKHINLSNNSVGDLGLQILSEGLKFNKNISSVDLSNNKITDKGGFYMADAMIKNQTIEILNLSSNAINDNGLSSLLTVLTNNNIKLKSLDLSNNQFIPSDFKNVADLIANTNNIRSLDLSLNKIEPQSAYLLGLALKQTKSLERIKINSIDLNEEAAPLLLKNLTDCKVSEIYLDNNPFGEIGAIIFANVFKTNRNLKVVSIRRSKLTPMFLICLSKVLLFNDTIEHLILEENTFDEESIILLVNSIKNKKIKIHFSKSSVVQKIYDDFKNVENFVFK